MPSLIRSRRVRIIDVVARAHRSPSMPWRAVLDPRHAGSALAEHGCGRAYTGARAPRRPLHDSPRPPLPRSIPRRRHRAGGVRRSGVAGSADDVDTKPPVNAPRGRGARAHHAGPDRARRQMASGAVAQRQPAARGNAPTRIAARPAGSPRAVLDRPVPSPRLRVRGACGLVRPGRDPDDGQHRRSPCEPLGAEPAGAGSSGPDAVELQAGRSRVGAPGLGRGAQRAGQGSVCRRRETDVPGCDRHRGPRPPATRRPVGMLVWRGAHAWVMSGFEATADPGRTNDFRVTAVRILDPWYPRRLSAWVAPGRPIRASP